MAGLLDKGLICRAGHAVVTDLLLLGRAFTSVGVVVEYKRVAAVDFFDTGFVDIKAIC